MNCKLLKGLEIVCLSIVLYIFFWKEFFKYLVMYLIKIYVWLLLLSMIK